MKKILLTFLSIGCTLLTTFVNVSAEEYGPNDHPMYNGFEYEFYNDEVTLYGYYGTDKDIVMPEEINGYPVTGLDWLFLFDENGVDSITISKNIKGDIVTIQDDSWIRTPFTYGEVNEFIVDEENPYLASYNGALYSKDYTVLYNCPSNQSVLDTHPNLESITPNSMQSSCFETIILHKNISDLGNDYWGQRFFQGLKTIKSIIVEEGNEKYISFNDALYEKNGDDLELLMYPCAREAQSYSIADGTTIIDGEAFRGCDNLKRIVFPESVVNIEDSYYLPNYTWYVYEGTYAHNYAVGHNYTYKIVGENVPGEINGDGIIDYSDAVLILQSDSGLTILDELQQKAADVNDDGIVNYSDAVQILRYDAGLITEL